MRLRFSPFISILHFGIALTNRYLYRKRRSMQVWEHKKRVFSQVIEYPDSDGQPMADNTLQALWIIMLYNNLRGLYNYDEVFVATDLLWYPVEGDPKTRIAPDVLLVFGRPDGYRGSYKQWLEEGIPPKVVFDIFSPSNTYAEMKKKRAFYEKYGVEEFIILDPEQNHIVAYVKKEDKLVEDNFDGERWTSPTLGVHFSVEEDGLTARYQDGTRFQTFDEVKTERQAAIEEKEVAIEERNTAIEEKDAALAEIEQLKARLRELGEDV